MTSDPYKPLRGQARHLKQHDKDRQQLLATRNQYITQLRQQGHPLTRIADAAGISREMIYQITKDTQ